MMTVLNILLSTCLNVFPFMIPKKSYCKFVIINFGNHCLHKGPYFRDLVLNKDLFGILGICWVLTYIFTILVSFMQRMSIQSACLYICRHRFRFTLLANFDFDLCLRINFHTSSFWVLILAAGGPYWVLISQKNGSLSLSFGVFISFRDSGL